jgi:hypothetical protein
MAMRWWLTNRLTAEEMESPNPLPTISASSPTPAQTASALTELAAPADAVRYVASVEDAEKHLELTPSQKADLERVIADTAREREALHRLPGEDGKTWDDAAKETFRRG